MKIEAMLPALVALGGGLLYLLPIRHSSVRQLALVAFGCGLLVTLFGLAGHTVRLP